MIKETFFGTMIFASVILFSCTETKDQKDDATRENEMSFSETEVGNDDLEEESNNWDQMLDDYEEYVSSYMKLYKKAMNVDSEALSEYPALMEKALALQESIEKAQKEEKLNPKQLTRMAEIQVKMLEAMK